MHAISTISSFFYSDLIIPFSMESCFSHTNVIGRMYGKLWKKSGISHPDQVTYLSVPQWSQVWLSFTSDSVNSLLLWNV